MKRLFDENLSTTLSKTLSGTFPGSAHLRDVALLGADDATIWQYAAAQQFVIVSKDDDFREISILRGAPPKVIILRMGNCRTSDVAEIKRITQFEVDETASLLELP